MRTSLIAAGIVSSALIALASWTEPAGAQSPGVRISWSECLPKGGTTNLDFSCGVVDGSETLVMTFSPPQPVPQMVGLEAVITISTAPPCVPPCSGPTLPSWWQFQASPTPGCRMNSLTFSADFTKPPFSVGGACVTPWTSDWLGKFVYVYPSTLYGSSDPSTALLEAIAVIPAPGSTALAPGHEYYAFRFIIDNLKTVGLPGSSCDGCCTPLYLSPWSLDIAQPAGVGDSMLIGGNTITWQGAGGNCGPTPARRTTWGEIKSQYR